MMAERIRVLVVDDDPAVALLHHQFVDAHPAFVVVAEAYDGASALDGIERLAPEVVLLDFYLPDISGLEVLRRTRAGRGRHVEVIAVTAARDLESVREARAGGVRHYLVKPFTAAALRTRLDEIARHSATLRRSATGALLTQHGVDEIIAAPAPRERTERGTQPKGLSAASLQRVMAALQDAEGDLSAGEVAELTGMSRVSARRYLEHLVDRGLAASTPRYGAAGRPENRFRSTL